MSDYILATGRRKTAVATVRLRPGAGKIEVNGKALEDYFPSLGSQTAVLQPLQLVKNDANFDVTLKTTGGGMVGQAGAAKLAIARALIKFKEDYRPILKAEGCLTRDPRMRERKKSGQPGARRRFQFSKR
ncbi:MAG: 30S ribosomal protein S9 [Verrucomicrobiia bacterium]